MLKNAIPLVLSMIAGTVVSEHRWQSRAVLDPEPCRACTAALRRNPELAVLLKADTALPMAAWCGNGDPQRAGAKKVGFITDPLPSPRDNGS